MSDHNMAIEIDPEVYKAFQQSQHVSVQNGSSGHLMKASAARRRTKVQIEEEKLNASLKEQEIQEKLQAWDQLEKALEESEAKQERMKQQVSSIQNLYDDGLIKKMDDGKYVVVESKEEKEQLKEKRSKPKRRGNIEPLNYDEGSIDLGLDQEDLE